MKSEDFLFEENKSTDNKTLRRVKTMVFVSFGLFFLILVGLHLFGNWSISRDDITHYNGDPNSNNMKFLSAETKFTFDNQCLLFRQSHNAVEIFEGDTKKHDTKPIYWQILNSFKFAFIDHLLLILSFLILAMFMYYLLKNVYRQKTYN